MERGRRRKGGTGGEGSGKSYEPKLLDMRISNTRIFLERGRGGFGGENQISRGGKGKDKSEEGKTSKRKQRGHYERKGGGNESWGYILKGY